MPDRRLTVKNCAVSEETGDGRVLGRCWHYVGDACVCERHGDVRRVQEHYLETGELTRESRLRAPSARGEGKP